MVLPKEIIPPQEQEPLDGMNSFNDSLKNKETVGRDRIDIMHY